MLKCGSFSLTAIFSLFWALMFSVFSKCYNFGQKNNIDFWFAPIYNTDCTLQSCLLNSSFVQIHVAHIYGKLSLTFLLRLLYYLRYYILNKARCSNPNSELLKALQIYMWVID